jgi:hypothetical protein
LLVIFTKNDGKIVWIYEVASFLQIGNLYQHIPNGSIPKNSEFNARIAAKVVWIISLSKNYSFANFGILHLPMTRATLGSLCLIGSSAMLCTRKESLSH